MTQADRKRRPSYTLTGDNIVDHIHAQQELEHQTRNYFHFSPLWRAIQDHISDNGQGEYYSMPNLGRRHDINKVVLIEPPFDWKEDEDDHLGVKCYRGSGYSVSFKDAAIYGSPGEAQNLQIKFEVEWENSYESFTRNYTINLPIELCKVEDDFTEEAFDNYIEALRKEKEQAKREKDAATFRKLIEEYPALNAIECEKLLDKILKDED